jgi:hypothetical protein
MMDSVPRLAPTGQLGQVVPVGRPDRQAWFGILAVALLSAVLAILLLAMGREPWCICGYVKLWHGVVQSAGNSQHLTDWYSFAHVLDGFVFYGLLWLIGARWPLALRLVLATALAGAWEMFENTDFVIDHFRTATLALGYRGDSIVNSMSDVVACILGFAVAALLPVRTSMTLAASLGIIAVWVASADATLLPRLLAPFGDIVK